MMTDIQKMINDLVKKGFNLRQIAEAIGESRQAVQNWRNKGTQPMLKPGLRLTSLWAKECYTKDNPGLLMDLIKNLGIV